MSEEAQLCFIPSNEGQPSARMAWNDPLVNAASGNFYGATCETAESAWVRPRFDGYIDFQTKASAAIRNAVLSEAQHSETHLRLRELWRSAIEGARQPIQHDLGQAS
jgi:multiple sugar transport system substrate-binding protein